MSIDCASINAQQLRCVKREKDPQNNKCHEIPYETTMKAKCVAVIIILVVCLVQSDAVPGVPIFCLSNFCLCLPIMIVHTFFPCHSSYS